MASSIVSYVGESIGNLICGRYLNDGMVLSLSADLALAFFGLDIYSDIRDTLYLIDNWENSPECVTEAALVAAQYLPVVGALCKGSKWYACVKNSRKTYSIMQTTSDALNRIKNTGVYRRAINLAFTAGKAVEELGGEVSWYIQQSVYRLKKTMWALDTRMNSILMEAYSMLPDETKRFLRDNRGMLNLDVITEKVLKECGDDAGRISKSADEVAEVFEGR